MIALQRSIGLTWQGESIDYEYLYNPSHLGGLGDLAKSVYQKYFDERAVVDYDLIEMLRAASDKVKTQKLLLVAHSQGNFYANSFYDSVAGKQGGVPSESLRVYGVASPAGRVAGGGTWLTSGSDRVIAGLVASFPLTNILPPNTDITLQEDDDALGHNLATVYLKYRGSRIVTDIQTSLDALHTNTIQAPDQPCMTAPPQTLLHRAQGVAFAIADPVAETGVTAVKTTVTATVVAAKAVSNAAVVAGTYVKEKTVAAVESTGNFIARAGAAIGSAARAVGSQVPRVIGTRPENVVIPESTPVARAAEEVPPAPPLTPVEVARLRSLVTQLVAPLLPPRPAPRVIAAPKSRPQLPAPPLKAAPIQVLVVADIPRFVAPAEDRVPALEPIIALPPPPPPAPPRVISCCSGGGGGGGSPTPPPQQAPTAVTNFALEAQPFITTTATLSWTAPSDADTTQANLIYDIRVSFTTPITDLTSFQTAPALTPAPAVGASGSAETLTLVDLTPGTTYTAALQTSDGVNTATLSNIVTFTTLPKGDAPSPITDLALTNEYLRYPMTVQWAAPTDPETNYQNPTPHLTYQIRYATTPITDEASWDAATPLATPPAPASPGTVQTYAFTPPAANTAYSIVIRMHDGYQLGPISNVLTHTSAWFGTITTPTTWTAAESNIHVIGTLRFEAPLTIEPGVTVVLGEFAMVQLAAPLTAPGTFATPIGFTSVSATPAQYWQSIQFLDGSVGSTLSYVGFEKGGNIDGTLAGPMVDVQSGDVAMNTVTVQTSRDTGIACSGSATPTLTDSIIMNNTGTGFAVTFPCRPAFTNLSVIDNAINGVVYTGTLDTAYTVPVTPQPVFSGTITIAAGTTLTLVPSTVMMQMGALVNVDGTLLVNGTDAESVFIVSIRDTIYGDDPVPSDQTPPARGDWQAIRFRSGSTGTFTSVVFRYGGSASSATNTDAGVMQVTDANVLIDNAWFAHMNYGLEVHGALATAELRRTIFLNDEEPDPVYSVWNNPENPGTVHYVRINPTFAGIPPAIGTFDGGVSVEYITIDNLGSGAEVLAGWKILDLANTTFTFPTVPSFTLDAGASVIVHTGSGTNSATDLYWGRGIPVWNDSGDFATLKNSAGTVIDEAAYVAGSD